MHIHLEAIAAPLEGDHHIIGDYEAIPRALFQHVGKNLHDAFAALVACGRVLQGCDEVVFMSQIDKSGCNLISEGKMMRET